MSENPQALHSLLFQSSLLPQKLTRLDRQGGVEGGEKHCWKRSHESARVHITTTRMERRGGEYSMS